jgi:S-adenosylmethionine decarboxylase
MTAPFAPGTHLLIDFWGAIHLDETAYIERALNQAALACGATVLAIHLHSFGENAGITGVAMLAESHISIHTWPEIAYVALDVFMCGNSNPHLALPVLREFFQPKEMTVTGAARGKLMSPALI